MTFTVFLGLYRQGSFLLHLSSFLYFDNWQFKDIKMEGKKRNNPSNKLSLEATARISDGLLLSLPHITQAARLIVCTPTSGCSVVKEVVQVTLPFITCQRSFWVWARCRLSFAQSKKKEAKTRTLKRIGMAERPPPSAVGHLVY